ncbi:MAG: hypothetical protein FJ308_23775, partial [Planctomycetes bacterium]|nr:hypothetical protein [Planctomycetota bacterium]
MAYRTEVEKATAQVSHHQRIMRLLVSLVMLLIVLVPLSGLAQSDTGSIRFIDLTKFDSDLEKALSTQKESVLVTFYEKTSPNNMPNRLQKWISSVEKSGGKLT